MGLCACNSAGHLSNHAEVAPNHAGVTFSVSNTLVSKIINTHIIVIRGGSNSKYRCQNELWSLKLNPN